jgi:hypothetical protein
LNTLEFKGKIFFLNGLKSVPQKKFFAENTEIADAIYGTGYKTKWLKKMYRVFKK